MKKIIKHGNTHFKTTCPYCGCEFEYDSEDLEERNCWSLTSNSLLNGYKIVKCPDCGAEIYHSSSTDFPQYPKVTYSLNNYTDEWPDCETCPNKPDFKNGKFIVGDTPCTWCRKNQPMCSTATTAKFNANAKHKVSHKMY